MKIYKKIFLVIFAILINRDTIAKIEPDSKPLAFIIANESSGNGDIYLMGSIQISSSKRKTFDDCSQAFYIYYNGQVIKPLLNDPNFIIKDFQKNRINFLFTSPENITFNAEENTISFFKLGSDHSYKFFEAEKTRNKESLFTWNIQKKDLPDEKTIPINTLVIPINPDLVEINLENINWKPESKIIKLPIIKINQSDKLEEQLVKGSLVFINLKPFHACPEVKKIELDNHVISMVVE